MISIAPNRIRAAEYHRNVWSVTPEADATLLGILAPGFFTHVAAQFRVGDHVEVTPEGGAWYAELLVRSVSKLDVKFGVLTYRDFDAAPAGITVVAEETIAPATEEAPPPAPPPKWDEDYVTKWAGPKAKFRIQRLSDRSILKDGFDTEADAKTWMNGHLQAMAV